MRQYSTLQNPQQLKSLFQRRLWTITLIIAFLFLVLVVRLFYLQIIANRYYSTLSANNSINLAPISPPRGLIYDRNGILLADNVPAYNLMVIPNIVPDMPKTIEELRKIVVLSDDDIKLFNRQISRRRSFQEVPIRMKLSEDEVAKFSINQFRFPGVHIQVGVVRRYPFANDLVTVLGYVGRINEQELGALDQDNYAGSDYIGKIGIEKYYEQQLHGTVGYRQVEMDASGREVRTLKTISPIPGEQLYLTIDSKLEEAAIQAMQGLSGALVAIDPNNGQILALVSMPAYDPNMFVNGVNTQEYKKLRQDPSQPLFNRAIRGQYPFGSTIKVFLALQALQGRYVDPKIQIFDQGEVKLGSHVFHDMHKHGWVDFSKAIEVSCDTYFYLLALKMGIHPMNEIIQNFGFGQYTGIEMNEELRGLVPTPAWKQKTLHQGWYPGDNLNFSIGQGWLLTTPLQLAHGVATLSMRGQAYQPTLILKTIKPDGHVTIAQSRLKPEVKLDDATWDGVIEGMVQVIRGPQGTGYRFGRPEYSVAAKTGTAQVFSLRGEKYNVAKLAKNLHDNSMFITFAPVDHPQIAIAVAIQNSPEAAKIARKVMDYYLLTEGHWQKGALNGTT
ncbi:MAG: penicillin-binding protein 2 [Gammaproteobacteria bacterium]|nr:penicillin-binding protein 2 [Gammaproteobacteria bacterium]